jgi:hypothetical protein
LTVFAATKDSFTTAEGLLLQSIDGFGFRPTVVFAWWARQPQSGVARGNAGGIGFWTEEESGAVAWVSDDGKASTSAARLAESAALLGVSEAGDVTLRARVESFDQDGVTLRYTTIPAESWVVHVLAFGGSMESDRLGWMHSPPTAVSNETGPWPAKDDLVLVLAAPLELGVVARSLEVMFGAADTRSAAVSGFTSPDGSPPGAVTGIQRCGPIPLALPALGRQTQFCYISLDGLRAKVGTDVSPLGRGSRYTRVGFRPEALILFSWGLPSSTAVASIGRLCIGGWASNRSGCVSWDDRNIAAENTMTHAQSSQRDALLVSNTRTGGIHAQATVTAIDDGGFTLDWTNDGGHREFAYVALGGRSEPRRAARVLHQIRRLFPT